MWMTEWRSPIGNLLIAASELGLAGIYFEEHKHFKGSDRWQRDDQHPVLLQTIAQLGEYFAGQRQQFDLPLDRGQGTEFQHAVWEALSAIPYGRTLSYGDLAKFIGKPAAVRAVAAANGRNRLSIVVPCHRVIGSNGSLTGYAGGLANKEALLRLEQAAP